jgi:hypothetical protein
MAVDSLCEIKSERSEILRGNVIANSPGKEAKGLAQDAGLACRLYICDRSRALAPI